MTLAAPPSFFDFFSILTIGTSASGDCLVTLPILYESSIESPTTMTFNFFALVNILSIVTLNEFFNRVL